MKPTIRVPYFEIGTKNYVWGDKQRGITANLQANWTF